MKLDTSKLMLRSFIFLATLTSNLAAWPQSEVIKFNEKQEKRIQSVNSNFLGFHIRYKKGKNGEALIFYVMPPKADKLDRPSEDELQGVVVIVDSNGEILDVKPFKSKRGS